MALDILMKEAGINMKKSKKETQKNTIQILDNVLFLSG